MESMKGDLNSLVDYHTLTSRTKQRYMKIESLLNQFPNSTIAHIGTNAHLDVTLNQKNIEFISDIFHTNSEKKFDLIICTSVLPHLLNPGIAMEKIASLLKDNGLLFLSVNNDLSLHKRRKGISFSQEDYHYQLYEEETVKNLLKDTGFKIDKIEYSFESNFQKMLGKKFCGDIFFYVRKK